MLPRLSSSTYHTPLDSLRVMLRNKDILSPVLAPVESKPVILSSFSGSVIIQLHPIYQALQLVLYADEFDVVNPLGMHASVYKMLALYFTVANISSCLQSKTDMIQVLAICDISDVEVHGLKAVAEIIFDDIQVLEQQGIEVPDSKEQSYGSVLYIAGDNLNSHIIGEFRGNFRTKLCLLVLFDAEAKEYNAANRSKLRMTEFYSSVRNYYTAACNYMLSKFAYQDEV